jgi:hypothetical protein
MTNSIEVYKAINDVQAQLAAVGISKSRRNQQQGYQFRGIDEIYNVVSPMLAEAGLCILPRVLSRQQTERATIKGGVLFSVVVEVEFDFVSSKDGSRHTIKTFGEAMDSADKATNKAMSAAYKYAVIQAFAIPTEGDNDADAHSPEVTPAQPAAQPARQQLPPCPDAKIERWFQNVLEGKARAADLMPFASARYALTDAQKRRIEAFVSSLEKKSAADVAGFVAEMESAERQPGEDG